ncbi:membrane-bound lytic murein transglycosylase MltC [Muribacter muris]|uniref:Membrane-bound lytic murein transglycosylase C n=1 Tax=Muribacter muris TaxID=67855 RepID=A0A4Y9JUJ4_9PAST|nr:membrane-bound lytic murein transglycosylase MltC [Muribacter muris]MBF0785500.1 membrane-bound lytic murein transglycosylase MltC [Muribacter muris]MBF0826570.1 membrane-bound lytic murein transglycosylase MltC [Muribacter muris]TFV09228.1 membrane-bound lytic murein transglycosylase MltC [Muribacter muris]
MKKYLKYLPLVAIIPFLVACSGGSKKSTSKRTKNDYTKDTKGLDILTGQFSRNIDQIWGVNELLQASQKDYVKYTDRYYTRSHISFEDGQIIIETLGDQNRLRNAIIHTLLMGSDASGIDLFASGDTPISSNPFLAGQVVDHFGRSVTNIAVANDFATYLIQHKTKTRRLKNGQTATYVTIPMIANHVEVRARRYLPMVRQAARRYGIDVSLILGIMEVESAFNPYAVSYANAIGLMQVVPRTAGRDIFARKGFGGQPDRDYLYNPSQNIDAGTMYLTILRDEYLDGITNPTAKRYAMISAYNSGAGAVLRVFDRDKWEAIDRINHLQPEAVFRILTTAHPSSQARNYLLKVNKAQQKYRNVR